MLLQNLALKKGKDAAAGHNVSQLINSSFLRSVV